MRGKKFSSHQSLIYFSAASSVAKVSPDERLSNQDFGQERKGFTK